MITEDYVSIETAKLLNEKGFDEVCLKYALNDEIYNNGDFVICHVDDVEIGIPTLQMATKWLRENHNIYATSVPNGIGEYVFYPQIYKKFEWGWNVLESLNGFQNAEFISPEEAIEEGIKYCLENLI